jgi:hypothetical protein
MKRTLTICFLTLIYYLPIHAQAVYVDSKNGNDNNTGTEKAPVFSINKAVEIISRKDNDIYVIKINSGIYVLEKHVSVTTEKAMSDKRIIIEASILPDDSTWAPEKMPIVVNSSRKGEIPGEDYSYVISFLINEDHVTIRGIKFHGYFYPNTRYFPIARFNKSKTDLLVEQCMFVGDKDASHIQVGIIAHGNEIKIDHCVFYNTKNTTVFWEDSGTGIKTGNSLTNCIVYGAFQSAIWTAWPDKDFKFENNIISNCKHVWVKNAHNTTKYTIENCIIVNNKYFKGIPGKTEVGPGEFEIIENNVIKEGEISLRLMDNIDKPFPIDYLHIVPGSLGYDIGAGLFKRKNQCASQGTSPAEVKGPYFGQKSPGKTPQLFAPGILTQPNGVVAVTRIAFSPDGNECFFSGPTDWNFSGTRMYYTKCVNNVWTPHVLASFFPGYSCRQPYFSADGNKFYFSSNKNGTSDIWVVEHTSQGWGNPQVLSEPINTSSYEGMYTQTTDGTAYIESDRPGGQGKFDVWRISPQQPGQPQQIQNLGVQVNNSGDDNDPVVSPDGRYLIFGSNYNDLFVTFNKGNGEWSAPVNLNQYYPGINTSDQEYAPTISPDGRYLFFTRIACGGVFWVENLFNEPATIKPINDKH